MTKIALVDMDGTLCDYEGALRAELSKILGESVSREDLRNEKYEYACDLIKKQPGFWFNLKPIDLGFNVLVILQHIGYAPYVLTKGPSNKALNAWTEKVQWCRKWLDADTPITITEDKSLFYGRVLLDDWPPYCEAWMKNRPRGLVLMPAYDYNEGMDEKWPGRVVRVTGENWKEVRAAAQAAFDR